MPPTRDGLPSFCRSRAWIAAAGLCAASPAALAWDLWATLDPFHDGLRVTAVTGSVEWTTLQEGWAAGSSLEGSPLQTTVFRAWNGVAWDSDSWSGSEVLPGTGVLAFALWFHDTPARERPSLGEISLAGQPPPGVSLGAALAYDFQLVLAPFSSVQVGYGEAKQLLSVARSAGDSGTGIVGLRLFEPGAAAGAPGSAERPWFGASLQLEGGEAAAQQTGALPGLVARFDNPGAGPLNLTLRFEASALLLAAAPVPEPQAWALWLGGLAGLGLLRAGQASGGAASRRNESRTRRPNAPAR